MHMLYVDICVSYVMRGFLWIGKAGWDAKSAVLEKVGFKPYHPAEVA